MVVRLVARASNIPVKITFDGQWNSLGTYYFDGNGSVTITAANGSTVSTCADAVWFKFISGSSPPVAHIDEITPSPANVGQAVQMSGHGTISAGTISAYSWESNIDGALSTQASFSTSSLSEGLHSISFRVQNADGIWSETVTQTLVVGEVPQEYIIDNGDAQTSKTGTWEVSGASGSYGSNSVWSRDGATYSWSFSPAVSDYYAVSMWWTVWPSRSTAVPVSIAHRDGTQTLSINQQKNGGQWNKMAELYFEAGNTYALTITAPYGSSISTCADAVKFEQIDLSYPPVADFSADQTAGIFPLSVQFADHSDGIVTDWLWNFGDGSTSTLQNPSHIYASAGTYTVSLTVSNADGSDTMEKQGYVVVSGSLPPVAHIDEITPSPANIGQTVQMSGHGTVSAGTISAYLWESDIDGTLSTQASFSTSSLSEGQHTISFKVQNADGIWSETVTQTLMVGEAPQEYIIDNGDAQTSKTGTWEVSGASGSYGTSSVWSRDGATYSWSFSPAVSDYYAVSMWWTVWSSRSTAVPVRIAHKDGIQTLTINQQTKGGQWNKVAELYFEAGNTYALTITAPYGSASTCADAVKFEQIDLSGAPAADFSADRTAGSPPLTVQFADQSDGIVTDWLWNFGDGSTSIQKNPSHTYASAGTYTVSLTAGNSEGSDTMTKTNYITAHQNFENIYIADGYSYKSIKNNVVSMLNRIGAVEGNGVWTYATAGKTFYIRIVTDPVTLENALKEEGSHIVYNGHSNFGFGALFSSESEFLSQEIRGVYYIDDDRFTNYSTDMVSTKVDGMQFGQAYPDWNPVFKDGTSGIMPYDFSEGTPPYNYFLTYTIPGDPTTYKVELSDGTHLERFPDAKTPAWYSADGSLPDPVLNPEYFITNPNPDYEKCEFTGDWPYAKVAGAGFTGDAGYLGYNYQYRPAGSGANVATWTIVIENPDWYVVMASWRALSDNATNAKYVIHHANGTSTVTVDQRQTAVMNTLGMYYFEQGTYTIRLSDNADGRVIADAIILSPTSNPTSILQAEFEADTVKGSAPLSVTFKDRSLYQGSDVLATDAGIQQWLWDFGDGTSSTQQNPSHTYASAGTYTVSLRVTDDANNEDTEVKQQFVVVGNTAGQTQAEFFARARLGADKTVVDFRDQSSGNITAWFWNFGDGSTSSAQNPTHVYTSPGIYTVSLTVSGTTGMDTETETDYIYNNIGMMFIDNAFKVKPHFNSGSTVKFGKVICDTGDIKIPENELRYSRMFYNSCNSCNYYVGTFHRGKLFCSVQDADAPEASVTYVENYLKGWSDSQLLIHLNYYQPIFEFIDFTKLPPSLR
ncbi:MAG: PKD domain-containing protein [Desulfobacterales bacterium]